MTEDVLKECRLCHQMLPVDQFYDRKDRDGEYNWKTSYCKSCDIEHSKQQKKKNPDKYKEYCNNRSFQYYHENKDKYQIYHRRAYYKRLSPEKQKKYIEKLQKKSPNIVNKIIQK